MTNDLKYTRLYSYFCCLYILLHLASESEWNINGIDHPQRYKDWQITVLVSARLMSFTWFYLFWLFNTKSVKFKIWVYKILAGYKMLSRFESASIFIVGNWFFKEKPEDSDPPSEFGISSLQMDNNDIDYEDNDDYMKNYKKALHW